MPDIKSQKSKLRQEVKNKRNSLSKSAQKQAAYDLKEIIIQNLKNFIQIDSRLNTKNINIAMYLAQKNELSLEYFINYCFENTNNIQCYLPILNLKSDHNKLLFIKYSKNTKLVANKYNIYEPCSKTYLNSDVNINNNTNTISPENLDIVLMPLVAFTKKGDRLGMGAGYYDRTFAFLNKSLNNNNNNNKPLLIGIAYDLQCVDYIPTESWDIKLDAIATETKFYNLNNT